MWQRPSDFPMHRALLAAPGRASATTRPARTILTARTHATLHHLGRGTARRTQLRSRRPSYPPSTILLLEWATHGLIRLMQVIRTATPTRRTTQSSPRSPWRISTLRATTECWPLTRPPTASHRRLSRLSRRRSSHHAQHLHANTRAHRVQRPNVRTCATLSTRPHFCRPWLLLPPPPAT